MARYEAGETLSSIARTYDCSPPAISYIVNRSRARQPDPAKLAGETPRPASAGEVQLVKTHNGNGADHREPAAPPPSDAVSPQPALMRRPPEAPMSSQPNHREDPRPAHGNGNGFERPHWPAREPQPHHAPVHSGANADQRARLHLQLGNGTHPDGGVHSNDPRQTDRPEMQPSQHHPSNGGGERPAWAAAASQPHQPPAPQHGNGYVGNGGHAEPRKESGGAFIDRELRARVEGDIAAFLAAFDEALAQDTAESRGALREATDRLLRAGARTRIELERLEARIPLPPRDAARHGEPAWRR